MKYSVKAQLLYSAKFFAKKDSPVLPDQQMKARRLNIYHHRRKTEECSQKGTIT